MVHTGEVALKTAVDEPMNLAKPVFVINESFGQYLRFLYKHLCER